MVAPAFDENPPPPARRSTVRRLGRWLSRASGFLLLFVVWGGVVLPVPAIRTSGLAFRVGHRRPGGAAGRPDPERPAGCGRTSRDRPAFPSLGRVEAGWIVLAGLLIGSLGLIAWSGVRPGGPMPPPKADADAIRVVTWNILVGDEEGPFWRRHGWPVRKDAIRSAIAGTMPDILCVQEALDAQTRWIAGVLPRHHRVGVGRDDGRSGGEHCAIYFDGDRFEELGGGTFWLEEPADEPPIRTLLGPKRICTWVRLRDRQTARSFRVYNLHLYLTDAAQTGCRPTDPGADRPGRFRRAGVRHGRFQRRARLGSAAGCLMRRASGPVRSWPGCLQARRRINSTGFTLRSLDEILVDRSWRSRTRVACST